MVAVCCILVSNRFPLRTKVKKRITTKTYIGYVFSEQPCY